jgi:hypothetical protein
VIAAALPIALAAGILAELAAGGTSRLVAGERRWWRRVSGIWPDLRRLSARGRERATVVEAGAAAGALLGAGIAAAGAIGWGPRSLAVLYLALAAAAGGGHLAASAATARPAATRAREARVAAAFTEVLFVAGIAVAFLRWRADGLDAIRGAQEVLGPSVTVGPVPVLGGLVVAMVIALAAGAVRLPGAHDLRRGPGRPAAGAILVSLCRWAGAGATALLVASVVAGPGPLGGTPADLLVFIAAAAAAAVVLGLAGALLAVLPRGARAGAWAVGAVLLVGAAVLVVLS